MEIEIAERMAIRIVVAGEIFIDQVLSGFTHWPAPGEEIFATSMVKELGGGAPHTAAGLHRLGWNVALAGPLGVADSAWVHARMRELGLGTTHLTEVPGEPTGATIAISLPEDRTFFTYGGANKFLPPLLEALPPADHIHLACTCEPALLHRLAAGPATVSLDAGWNPNWLCSPQTLEALPTLTWFLPNEREAAHITGETTPHAILQKLRELKINTAIKLGALGSTLMTSDGAIVSAPPFPIAAIDTTGAGDNFNAGFLDAWLRGAPPLQCLRKGNYLGALSTRAMGGMNGFPTNEELQSWA